MSEKRMAKREAAKLAKRVADRVFGGKTSKLTCRVTQQPSGFVVRGWHYETFVEMATLAIQGPLKKRKSKFTGLERLNLMCGMRRDA